MSPSEIVFVYALGLSLFFGIVVGIVVEDVMAFVCIVFFGALIGLFAYLIMEDAAETEQTYVIQGTPDILSEDEMHAWLDSITSGTFTVTVSTP